MDLIWFRISHVTSPILAEPIAMKQHRALYRLPIDRTGELSRHDHKVSCRIVDLTAEGVRIESALEVRAGEELQLAFSLSADKPIHCDLHVVSVHPPFIGGRLVNLSSADQQSLNAFIEEFLDLNFMGM
jgi:hypothetical protein